MIFNNLPIAFPWYDSLNKQARFTADKEGFNSISLIAPNDAILPFQLYRPTSGQLPVYWAIYNMAGALVVDLMPFLPNLNVKTINGNDYFWYVADSAMNLDPGGSSTLAPGCYYMRMGFPDGLGLFSETFKVPEDQFSAFTGSTCNYLKIEWSNDGDIYPIYYTDGFVNVCYLDSRVTSSEPEIDEETQKDGNNIDVPIFQRAAIKYRITAFVGDFLKIALSTLSMHDSVILTTPNALETGEIEQPVFSSQVEDGGFISQVDIVFEQDLLMTSTLCPQQMIPAVCPPMPSDSYLNLNYVDNGGGSFSVFCTIPTYCYGAIIAFFAGGTFLTSKTATRAQWAAGVQGGHPPGTNMRAKPLTFNCDLPYSSPVAI